MGGGGRRIDRQAGRQTDRRRVLSIRRAADRSLQCSRDVLQRSRDGASSSDDNSDTGPDHPDRLRLLGQSDYC